MKKEIDYRAMTGYDWSLFTEEDEKEYGEILLSMPYDPELMRFFHEQRKQWLRERNQKDRYAAGNMSSVMNSGRFEPESPDTWEEQSAEEKTALYQEIEQLEPLAKRRVIAHYFGHKTYRQIAEEEGVTAAAVCRSVRIALGKIRKGLVKDMGQ